MITLRGGGGIRLPEIVITFRPTGGGGGGGASRITNGGGVVGRGGCCLITNGGAGGVNIFGSCWIKISPGGGGVGGRRYLIATSC